MIDNYMKNHDTWIFFVLAIGISWFSWIWVIIFDLNVWAFPGIVFGAFGLFGPSIAEVILINKEHDKRVWEDYWGRVFNLKRIKWHWYLVIFLLFPLMNAILLLGSSILGAPLPEFGLANTLFRKPWLLPMYIVFYLLFGPVPEELGWRGYALDRLQVRYNAFYSSVIIGLAWSLWHVPLFFMKGTFQHDVLKFGTINFWSYLLGPFLISVLFTWVYNNNNRSTLSAIFLHFSINFSGDLLPLQSEAIRVVSIICIFIIVVAVTYIWGPWTLTRKRQFMGDDRLLGFSS